MCASGLCFLPENTGLQDMFSSALSWVRNLSPWDGKAEPRCRMVDQGCQGSAGADWGSVAVGWGDRGFPCFFSGAVNAAAEDMVVGATGCLTSGHKASLSASETGLSEAIGGVMLPRVDICRAEWPTVWATKSACLDSDLGSPTHDLLTLGKLFPS